MKRSEARNRFLTDLLVGAVENSGYGFFATGEYVPDAPLGEAYAVIVDEADEVNEDDPETFRVDLDVIAKGLAVIRNACLAETDRPSDGRVLHNAATGERLFLAEDRKVAIGRADRANDDELSELDVVDYLAILECGLFGRVVYA